MLKEAAAQTRQPGRSLEVPADLVCLQFAEKVIFQRLVKNAPACAEASAGRQMQVKLYRNPASLAGAPEILRSEAYLAVRCNDEG